MTNQEIRKKMKDEGIYLWQVAEKIHLHESTLIKKFRKELPLELMQEVLAAVEEIKLDRLRAKR